MMLKLHGHHISYCPSKGDRVKTRLESNPFVKRLIKNKRLVVAETDGDYEDVLNYSWRRESTARVGGLQLLNLQVEVGEFAGYLISVAVPQGSA